MLRASWGLTGNFDRSGGTTPVMVGRRTYIPAVGDYVVRLSTPPNPKLRWERNRSTNVSLDLGLFDRINATFTYYNNSCYDLLGSTLLDPTTGYASARINAADMTNKGFELQLGVDVLKLRNFNWNVNWIFAHNSNKITNNNINESSPHLNRVTGLTEFVEGYASEAIWSYRWAGLDSNGEPMVYDKDGNKTYDIATLDADDLEYSGTYQPKYNGSFLLHSSTRTCKPASCLPIISVMFSVPNIRVWMLMLLLLLLPIKLQIAGENQEMRTRLILLACQPWKPIGQIHNIVLMQ